jgi:hypothetical protein
MNERRGRTKWLTLRMRESELAAWHAAAQMAGEWTAEFVRTAVDRRVRRVKACKRARRAEASGLGAVAEGGC